MNLPHVLRMEVLFFYNQKGEIVSYIEIICGFTLFRFPQSHQLAQFGFVEIREDLGRLFKELFHK